MCVYTINPEHTIVCIKSAVNGYTVYSTVRRVTAKQVTNNNNNKNNNNKVIQ